MKKLPSIVILVITILSIHLSSYAGEVIKADVDNNGKGESSSPPL